MTARATTIVLLSGVALAVGCGAGGDSDSPSSPPAKPSGAKSAGPSKSAGPAKRSAKVDIADFKYAPDPIVVKAGGSVTWTNDDQAEHNAETDGSAKGAFSTGDLSKGDTKRVRFAKPGSYSYYCSFHRFMKGTVEVR